MKVQENAVNKQLRKPLVTALLLFPGLVMAQDAGYGSLQQFLEAGSVSGNIRSYYFNQLFGGSTLPNKYAYSLGGMLKVQTAPLYGVSAGVAFYTANALGANDLNGPGYTHLDPLLMGERNSLNVLGQAYLQYQDHWAATRHRICWAISNPLPIFNMLGNGRTAMT